MLLWHFWYWNTALSINFMEMVTFQEILRSLYGFSGYGKRRLFQSERAL